MRKSLKVMIAKAEEVCKVYREFINAWPASPELNQLIPELEIAIKKVKGEV